MGGSPTLDLSATGTEGTLTATASGTASFAAPTLYLSGTTSLLAGGVSFTALTSGHTLEMKAAALASLYGPSSFYIAASDTGTSSLSLYANTALLLNASPFEIDDEGWGARTTAASRILGDFTPPYESTITRQLLRDGGCFWAS